jgi:hypothetical protein
MNYDNLSLTEKIALLHFELSLTKSGFITIPAEQNDPEEIITFLKERAGSLLQEIIK